MAMVDRTCPCGKHFQAKASEVARGGGKYCSPGCYHRFVRDAARPDWKGDAVSYAGLHQWVRRLKGRPARCQFCGKTGGLEWANVSGEYKREAGDWMALCVRCHRRYDRDRRLTCRRGHLWTPGNTRTRTSGWRTCRTCQRETRRSRYRRGREKGIAPRSL